MGVQDQPCGVNVGPSQAGDISRKHSCFISYRWTIQCFSSIPSGKLTELQYVKSQFLMGQLLTVSLPEGTGDWLRWRADFRDALRASPNLVRRGKQNFTVDPGEILGALIMSTWFCHSYCADASKLVSLRCHFTRFYRKFRSKSQGIRASYPVPFDSATLWFAILICMCRSLLSPICIAFDSVCSLCLSLG